MPTNLHEKSISLQMMSGFVPQPMTAPNDQMAVPVLSYLETEPMAKTAKPKTASLQFTLT